MAGACRPARATWSGLRLEWSGAGEPALQRSRRARPACCWRSRAVPLLLVVQFLASEWSRGRFAPLTPQAARSPAGSSRTCSAIRPSSIGAVWDRGVGPDEVAAMIARLAAEGKLETRVDGANDLHMKLKVERDTLGGYERALVDGFFFGGRKETSTADVRVTLQVEGLRPHQPHPPPLEAQAKALVGPAAHSKWLPLWLPTLVAFSPGMYLFWAAAPATAEGRLPRFLGIVIPMLRAVRASPRDRVGLARPDRPGSLGTSGVPDPGRR